MDAVAYFIVGIQLMKTISEGKGTNAHLST